MMDKATTCNNKTCPIGNCYRKADAGYTFKYSYDTTNNAVCSKFIDASLKSYTDAAAIKAQVNYRRAARRNFI